MAALAHHYDAAGTAETAAKAVNYAGLAAEQAERRFAHREAARLWQQAINAFDRAHPDGSEPKRAAAAAAPADQGARAERRHGRGPGAAPQGDGGRAAARDLELTARIAASLAVPYKGMARDFTRTAWEIVDVTEKALVELPADEQVAAGEPARHARLELEGSDTGRGQQASLEAEELARQSGDPALLAVALSGRLRQSYGIPAVGEREAIGRELLEVGEASGQIAVQALAHLVLMECAAARGDFAEADRRDRAPPSGSPSSTTCPRPAAVAAWYAGQRLMIAGDYRGRGGGLPERGPAHRAGRHAGGPPGPAADHLVLPGPGGGPGGRDGGAARPRRTSARRKWTLDAYALALAAAGHERDARAIAAVRPPVRPDFLYELAMTWRALAGMLLGDDRAHGGGLRHARPRSPTASRARAPAWSRCGRSRRPSATSPGTWGGRTRPGPTTRRPSRWPSGWASPAGSPRPGRRSTHCDPGVEQVTRKPLLSAVPPGRTRSSTRYQPGLATICGRQCTVRVSPVNAGGAARYGRQRLTAGLQRSSRQW